MVSVKELLDDGVLITPELVEQGIDERVLQHIVDTQGDDLLVIDQELVIQAKNSLFSSSSISEKNSDDRRVNIVWSYDKPSSKRSYADFVKALNIRFTEIEKLLKSRQELSSTISISRIRTKKERESVAFIAMIIERAETANGHIMLTVEDRSSNIKVLISKNNQDMFTIAKDVQLDEVVGFTGTGAGEIVFADQLYFPDVPLTKELKKSPEEEYLVCVGDPHFGSKVFMKKEFEKFLLWINGTVGNDVQKALAKKVKYMIITGDLVEGVGIYPGQENDLEVPDITDQYREVARYLEQVPKHITIILYPGNHDAGRLSEPQEPLMRTYAQGLYDMENVILTSNPAMVNIGATDHFPGFDCLLYHGGSLIYYSDNIPSIRAAGGQKRVDLIMKWQLQRRHLAPTHNAAMTIPTTDRDYLLIDQVPDFFIAGHIHRASVSNYRNVTTINSSCWTLTTEDQIKRGLEPQPAKLVLVNLKTRAVKLMNFHKEETEPVSRGSDQARTDAQSGEGAE